VAGVYVNVPVGEIAGGTWNSDGFVLPVTENVTACPVSLGAPGEIEVAQLFTVCAPALNTTP